MAYDYILIPGTKAILHIDIEVEVTRWGLLLPILREHGRMFAHGPYKGEYKTLDPNGRCFDQAMMCARKMGLTYVEGFMVFQHPKGPLPIGHGWCVDKEGVVVDPTCWKYTGNSIVSYAGVPIKLEYSEAWKKMTGYYGCIDGYFDGETVNTDIGIYKDPPAQWLGRL
jgi:hypothetical protein